ncbi:MULTISPECIES: hypothetical protein [Paenibacillus]|uniref:hypothetical protein n=1 Tax=Paenibacillus TaxID=44249 RepID=UPI0022B91624|nr:hypothetical protein [Paenibacillus caseinilyticus]MCZ8521244.1 hypothetical protein [Paenibacillus caseinilyticus]
MKPTRVRLWLAGIAALFLVLYCPGGWMLLPLGCLAAGIKRIRSRRKFGKLLIVAAFLLFIIPYLLLAWVWLRMEPMEFVD